MMSLRWLFTFEGRVTPRQYLITGVLLMALKYLGEFLAAILLTGQILWPHEFLFFSRGLLTKFDFYARWYPVFVVLWSLPFLWIGLSMTVRRALDAGLTPWFSLWFLVPGVNYLIMVLLSFAESRKTPVPPSFVPQLQRGTLLAMGAAAGLAVLGAGLPHLYREAYGAALFLGFPVLIGALSAIIVNRGRTTPISANDIGAAAAIFGTLAIGLFALEGLVCLIMALPISFTGALLGASLGNLMVRQRVQATTLNACAALGLFVIAAPPLEHLLTPPAARVVESEVIINAPVERVWEAVIEFPEIPEERSWIFHTGIAWPVRARLEGRGVGAVRYCEFSTGAFVEPITVWNPPYHLAFDVVEQPPALEETFLWEGPTPPHVLTAVQSKRGEFRLERLDGDRTRLIGRTWYDLTLRPANYWGLLADEGIHRIHLRVLEHIRSLAESPPAGYGTQPVVVG